jgi:two-component system CheB/CheR fusion protein
MRRMLLRRSRQLTEYVRYLRAHPDELQALHADLLIGVTSFFREGETVEYLQRTVLPRLLKDRARDDLCERGSPDVRLGDARVAHDDAQAVRRVGHHRWVGP